MWDWLQQEEATVRLELILPYILKLIQLINCFGHYSKKQTSCQGKINHFADESH